MDEPEKGVERTQKHRDGVNFTLEEVQELAKEISEVVMA